MEFGMQWSAVAYVYAVGKPIQYDITTVLQKGKRIGGYICTNLNDGERGFVPVSDANLLVQEFPGFLGTTLEVGNLTPTKTIYDFIPSLPRYPTWDISHAVEQIGTFGMPLNGVISVMQLLVNKEIPENPPYVLWGSPRQLTPFVYEKEKGRGAYWIRPDCHYLTTRGYKKDLEKFIQQIKSDYVVVGNLN